MGPRQALDAMFWKRVTDMPAMLKDRDSFFRTVEDRAMFILSEAAPEGEEHTQSVRDAFIVRSGVNA